MIKAVFYRVSNLVVGNPIIKGAEYMIDSVQINRSIKEFAHFEFEIKAENIRSSFNITDNETAILVRIYKGSKFIIEGLVVNAVYGKESIQISCEDILYNLSWRANTSGDQWKIYRNVQPAVIIRNFLINTVLVGSTSRYDIGNFFFWTDLVNPTNFDSREERVLSDIMFKLSDSMKTLYYQYFDHRPRYFSHSDPNYRFAVNLGTFERNLHFEYNQDNIIEFDIEIPHEPVLTTLFLYGDTYENPANTINVLHLGSGTIANTDPDYPVSVSGINSTMGYNTPIGGNYRRSMTEFTDINTPTKVTPGASELNDAATGIYNEGVKIFNEYDRNDIILNITSNQFPESIMPGNIVKVRYDGSYRNFNPITNQVEKFDMGRADINQEFYVQDYSLDINNEADTISLTLIDNQRFKDKEPTKLRKKQLKKIKQNKEFFVMGVKTDANLGVAGLYDLTIGSGLAANTTLNGNPARQVTVTKLAANFGGLTNVNNASVVLDYYACAENDEITNIDFVSAPAAGNLTFNIAVQVNDNWTVNDELRVKLLVFWDV